MEVRSCVSVQMADWKPWLRLVRMLWVGCMAVCDDWRILQGTEERWVGNSWGVIVALFEGTGDVGVRLHEGRGDGVSDYLVGTFTLFPHPGPPTPYVDRIPAPARGGKILVSLTWLMSAVLAVSFTSLLTLSWTEKCLPCVG